MIITNYHRPTVPVANFLGYVNRLTPHASNLIRFNTNIFAKTSEEPS